MSKKASKSNETSINENYTKNFWILHEIREKHGLFARIVMNE